MYIALTFNTLRAVILTALISMVVMTGALMSLPQKAEAQTVAEMQQ